eukprot:357516-Chlamydomonas_euryale.AAC.4
MPTAPPLQRSQAAVSMSGFIVRDSSGYALALFYYRACLWVLVPSKQGKQHHVGVEVGVALPTNVAGASSRIKAIEQRAQLPSHVQTSPVLRSAPALVRRGLVVPHGGKRAGRHAAGMDGYAATAFVRLMHVAICIASEAF